MSRSTLPDLFKADLYNIKFHPQDQPRKIGGRFSIKLTKNTLNQQSQQKPQNQLNKLQTNNGFNKSIYDGVQSKYRSQSIGNIPSAIKYDSTTRNSLVKPKKSVGFNININQQFILSYKNNKDSLSKSGKHSQSFTKDTLTLKQIHYQNVMRNKILSTTTNRNQQLSSVTNFPYQTTRTMNNMQIDLEQAQSFKNRVDVMIQQEKNCQKILIEINKQTLIIKQHMDYFHSAYLSDLTEFNEQFKYLCKDLMRTLSQMRRQTGQQTKQNAFHIDRITDQYKDATAIFDVIDYRTNILRNQCIEDHKIQLTNRKTYTQDLQLKIQQSNRETQLDQLLKRTKRSTTSHTMRPNINNLPLHTTQKQTRAQTLSYKRKPINNINFQQNNQQLINKINKIENNKDQNSQRQSQKDSLDFDLNLENITISNLKQRFFEDY